MRHQQRIWQEIHQKDAAFPSYALPEPSGMVVAFVEYLRTAGVVAGTAVDVGCGKGRNSVFLAQSGFEVSAMDYIEGAILAAQKAVIQAGVEDRVSFVQTGIDEPWPFANEVFDVAIDCFSSIDIEIKAGREVCRDELYRTLKPGGYALVCVVSAADNYEAEMIKKSPGPEPNSTIWPDNGKFQKDYTEAELRDFFQMFRIAELQEKKKSAQKMGRSYTATNFWVVLQKMELIPAL